MNIAIAVTYTLSFIFLAIASVIELCCEDDGKKFFATAVCFFCLGGVLSFWGLLF